MRKTRDCNSYTMNLKSKAKEAGAMDDNYMSKIKRENINFDSYLLEKGVSYA